MCEDAPQFPLAVGAPAPLRAMAEKRGSAMRGPRRWHGGFGRTGWPSCRGWAGAPRV